MMMCIRYGFFVGIWIFGLWTLDTFAESNPEIHLRVSTTQVEMQKPFDIILEIRKVTEETTFASQGIAIPGIEHFAQVGSATSTSIQRVNGKSAIFTEIRRTVLPQKTGTFTLGPVELPITDEQGQSVSVRSPSISVTVIEATDSSSFTPPQTLGDDSSFFVEPSQSSQKISFFPEGNTSFWLQVGGLALVFWCVWFLLNKKFEQIKKRREKPTNVSRKESSVPESLPLVSAPSWDIEFPLAEDPAFLEKVQKIFAQFCQDTFDLTVAQMTKREVLPSAQKHFEDSAFRQLQELLEIYEKARFAKLPIDRKMFIDRLELFLRKYYQSEQKNSSKNIS